jgi:hypothetical protein
VIEYLRQLKRSVQRLFKLNVLISNLGWLQIGKSAIQNLRYQLFKTTTPYTLMPKNARFPLLCRPRTSDKEVFN